MRIDLGPCRDLFRDVRIYYLTASHTIIPNVAQALIGGAGHFCWVACDIVRTLQSITTTSSASMHTTIDSIAPIRTNCKRKWSS